MIKVRFRDLSGSDEIFDNKWLESNLQGRLDTKFAEGASSVYIERPLIKGRGTDVVAYIDLPRDSGSKKTWNNDENFARELRADVPSHLELIKIDRANGPFLMGDNLFTAKP